MTLHPASWRSPSFPSITKNAVESNLLIGRTGVKKLVLTPKIVSNSYQNQIIKPIDWIEKRNEICYTMIQQFSLSPL